MSERSAIQWTQATWNPVTGCDRVSPGCAHCYAAKMAARLKEMGNARYQKDGGSASGLGFGVALHPDLLDLPLRWKKPRMIFVNSMSDLFHEEVPDDFIDRVFATMALAPRHTFQVLTKRPTRMHDWSLRTLSGAQREHLVFDSALLTLRHQWRKLGRVAWPGWPLPNVWLGVSVENQRWADERIPLLLETPAAVRFVSLEPLLGPVDLRCWLPPFGAGWTDRPNLSWAICGGESAGPAKRRLVEWCGCTYSLGRGGRCSPLQDCDDCGGAGWQSKPHALEWVRNIRDQCVAAGVPFFFKQWGGPRPKAGGALLDGREWREVPA